MSIWREYWEINKARREELDKRMDDYDRKVYFPALKQLRDKCVTEGGHYWEWSHIGPSGHPWFHCTQCGQTECRTEES